MENQIKFNDLKVGQVFKYLDDICVKTENMNDIRKQRSSVCEVSSNALSLIQYSKRAVYSYEMVTPISGYSHTFR